MKMNGSDPYAKPPLTKPVRAPRRSGNHLPTMLMHVAYTSPAPMPPTTPKPRIASHTSSRCDRARNPTRHRPDPAYIARRAVRMPFSRSQPAGKAMPAWKNTQTLRIQKVLDWVQPCACERVSSAEPYAYSKTLIAIMAIHGR